MQSLGGSLVLLLLLLFGAENASSIISPVEDIFLSVPDAHSARGSLRYVTGRPHVAGTEGDYVMANFVARQFEEAGIPDVSTFHLDVLLNYPNRRPQVSVHSRHNVSRCAFRANLTEPALSFDDTSNRTAGWNAHIFHGYGASGTVAGSVVFANYGRPADFDALARAGISVERSVVVVRYGRCFRGLKVMNAQERGALGVVVYSDPNEDGYVRGETYPAGPWRPSAGVQRGSVQFNSRCAGDPMRADARYRGTVNNSSSSSNSKNQKTTTQVLCGVKDYTELIPSIPSVPMGYGDAAEILKRLTEGPRAEEVFEDFRGGLPIDYRTGPSRETVVRLSTDHRSEIKSIPNVVGVVPGTLPEDQDMPVLLGNHRDAWVFGAADPNSGTAGLIEVAKGLGKLLRTGWRPRRSIYLLSWSGEEYGLLGSTGWAELSEDKIRRAVAYLNADTLVSGDVLSVATTPALATLWENVLNDLRVDGRHVVPFSSGPIRDANTNQVLHHPEHKILGSGSDYTVFLDHFGVASLDFDFGKETTYGQYHSIYDSFSWMDAYGGRDEELGSAFDLMAFGAKIWGLLALRLADSAVLPIDHFVQGQALVNYTRAIEKQEPSLDLALLKRAVHHYLEEAVKLRAFCEEGEDIRQCNEKLGLTERRFLTDEGLPDRPWFKHTLQAPGMFLGYAAEVFPGIQQALDANDLKLAQQQVVVTAARIEKAASFMSVPTLMNDG